MCENRPSFVVQVSVFAICKNILDLNGHTFLENPSHHTATTGLSRIVLLNSTQSGEYP